MELYASSSGGENDHNPGSPRGKLEFSDQLVPQSAVTERQECYRVRESDRDNRDKVIASMDFRSVGGFFASATSCKELCIHRLAQAEGDGESFVAHRQSVDPRWVHRTSAKLSSLAWNNNDWHFKSTLSAQPRSSNSTNKTVKRLQSIEDMKVQMNEE